MADLAGIATAALGPPALAALVPLIFLAGRVRPRAADYFRQWISCGVGMIVAECVNGTPAKLIAAVASTLVAAICWWLSRRKRKRSAKLIGAKSRALLAAVVARMRETAKPRPVFKPAPGGAS